MAQEVLDRDAAVSKGFSDQYAADHRALYDQGVAYRPVIHDRVTTHPPGYHTQDRPARPVAMGTKSDVLGAADHLGVCDRDTVVVHHHQEVVSVQGAASVVQKTNSAP